MEPSNADTITPSADPSGGTIKVFLADPWTGHVRDQVHRTLTFLGVDDGDQVTFGPVTLVYAAVQTLEDVAVATTRLVVSDPASPGVLAVVRVTVQAARTAHVSDVVLQPARPALLAALRDLGDDVVAEGVDQSHELGEVAGVLDVVDLRQLDGHEDGLGARGGALGHAGRKSGDSWPRRQAPPGGYSRKRT